MPSAPTALDAREGGAWRPPRALPRACGAPDELGLRRGGRASASASVPAKEPRAFSIPCPPILSLRPFRATMRAAFPPSERQPSGGPLLSNIGRPRRRPALNAGTLVLAPSTIPDARAAAVDDRRPPFSGLPWVGDAGRSRCPSPTKPRSERSHGPAMVPLHKESGDERRQEISGLPMHPAFSANVAVLPPNIFKFPVQRATDSPTGDRVLLVVAPSPPSITAMTALIPPSADWAIALTDSSTSCSAASLASSASPSLAPTSAFTSAFSASSNMACTHSSSSSLALPSNSFESRWNTSVPRRRCRCLFCGARRRPRLSTLPLGQRAALAATAVVPAPRCLEELLTP
mmetsp:Transcript_26834/g.81213  ORF Transcript_26834/g.81213 Transcript_26834/m.81213 type:complete len:346 (-) Transcript_26834:1555-2592(-)|eukprot:scaffold284274_cov28-Tisochrysis_lutea.AAC.2